MNIEPIKAFQDNYIWLIRANGSSGACCVDPGDASPVLRYLKNNSLQLETILLTHHHQDHQGGVAELLQHYPEAHIYGPADQRMPLVKMVVQAGDIVPFKALNFQILSLPGHTSTHIAYYEQKQKLLFCGDTLFSAGCGRVFDGSLQQLYQSLLQLSQLPDATKVYCAHEYTLQNLCFAQCVDNSNQAVHTQLATIKKSQKMCTLPSTIQREKEINPFFRLGAPDILNTAKMNGYSHEPFAVFRCLRKLKDGF